MAILVRRLQRSWHVTFPARGFECGNWADRVPQTPSMIAHLPICDAVIGIRRNICLASNFKRHKRLAGRDLHVKPRVRTESVLLHQSCCCFSYLTISTASKMSAALVASLPALTALATNWNPPCDMGTFATSPGLSSVETICPV